MGSFSSNDSSNIGIDILNILNESTDKVNLSSLSFFQTKQRRIDHRRNKSEPVIRSSLEDLSSSLNSNNTNQIFESSSTSTTSNDSNIIKKNSFEKKENHQKLKIFLLLQIIIIINNYKINLHYHHQLIKKRNLGIM